MPPCHLITHSRADHEFSLWSPISFRVLVFFICFFVLFLFFFFLFACHFFYFRFFLSIMFSQAGQAYIAIYFFCLTRCSLPLIYKIRRNALQVGNSMTLRSTFRTSFVLNGFNYGDAYVMIIVGYDYSVWQNLVLLPFFLSGKLRVLFFTKVNDTVIVDTFAFSDFC